MSLLYPDAEDVQYTVIVTFMDDVSVPATCRSVEHANGLFHTYVSDARKHTSDGAAYTVKRVLLSSNGGKFGTDEILNLWEREDGSDGLPDVVDVDDSPWIAPPEDALS